jgi:hypothetical protein
MVVPPILIFRLPVALPDFKKQSSIIEEIAPDTFRELVATCFMTAVTCVFVAEVAIPTLIITAVSSVAGGILVRAFVAVIMRSPQFLNLPKPIQDRYSEALPYINPYFFCLFDLMTRSTLVHEAGHFLAGHILVQNPNSSIEIFPLKGGVTWITKGRATNCGAFLGKTNSDLLLSAAGPFAGTLLALLDLGIAHKIKDTNQDLRKTLIMSAIFNVTNHALYAISALWENTPGHDFKKLWKVGNIHPITSVICIIALPLFFQGFLLLNEKLSK